MRRFLSHLRARPRLLTATLIGVAATWLLPGEHSLVTRSLLGWNVAGSWLLVPTMFTLTHARLHYRTSHGSGMQFPEATAGFKPDYGDFLYFAFTMAVASQTADVSISTPPMRRLVRLQSALSFAFNTAILAFTINIAASMF